MTGPDEQQVGGWAIRLSDREIDVTAMLETFGQVYRLPVEPGENAQAMAPGQPCFLVRTDRSRVIGIWALGEVVGSCSALPDSLAPAARPARTEAHPMWAEVELLALEKPIPLDKLLADPVLAASGLGTAETVPNPVALSRSEIRAIESFEFWMTDPTDAQLEALDALFAREDALDT